MKKLFCTLILLLAVCYSAIAIDDNHATIVAPTNMNVTNFVLYPTANKYTFLKLDTRNGVVSQVQFSMGNDQIEVYLNDTPLIFENEEKEPGRFALYPTTNMWTFLLLDSKDGSVWQIQWNNEKSNRGIWRIYKSYDN